jgi:dephospho-CoA kinase
MLRAGITGGIGSGKTAACTVFETLGIPVYNADAQAKRLMNADPELKTLLKGYFGNGIYSDGTLDRRRMAEIIFNDKIALEKVNGWVHPAVTRDFERWCSLQTSPYVLEEAAIIFESGIANRFHKIILVTAPDAVRIERVCARDLVTPDAVRTRMSNQWPEDRKIDLADYVIYNDGFRPITPQIMEIHKKLVAVCRFI